MFEIRVEWEDAPGVVEPLLAHTWARLELRVDDRPITRFWSERTKSVRDGVHGSVLPLARWVVDHWWNLLFEGARLSSTTGRPWRAVTGDAKRWLSRHNVLTCREGMAYPDLAIFRREDDVMLQWYSDPRATTTQGRFIDDGSAVVDRAQMEEALEGFVTNVIERVEGTEHEAVDELSALWSAITQASADERATCSRLGMLGQDPYDEDLDQTVEAAVEALQLPDDVVADLLSASSPAMLGADATRANTLLSSLPSCSPSASPRLLLADDARGGLAPYEKGYARAAQVRRHLGLADDEPRHDLGDVIEQLVGAPSTAWVPQDPAARNVDAAIQTNGVSALAATGRSEPARRFLQGRALHHWLFVATEARPRRLLTSAHDWVQAASRAFSAELLAPARALSKRLSGRADWEQQGELAEEFGVSPTVIAHQIDNHRLA